MTSIIMKQEKVEIFWSELTNYFKMIEEIDEMIRVHSIYQKSSDQNNKIRYTNKIIKYFKAIEMHKCF